MREDQDEDQDREETKLDSHRREPVVSGPRGGRGIRAPRFCLEMIDAALLDTDLRYRVVEGATPSLDGPVEEWIELAAPTSSYTDAAGKHLLAVTLRVDDGIVVIRSYDFYPPGSLKQPSVPPTRPDGTRQVLWLACAQARGTRSQLTVEVVMEAHGRIDAILHLDKAGPFNRADVPGFVRQFAKTIDLAHDTLGALGLRGA